MNLKGFFVDALSTALDNGIATPDDVLRHVGPDVLAEHLPRPLWARLLTVCMGASRVDAQLVIETIGVPNLCEHVPTDLIWGVIAEVALRSLGREFVAATPVTRTAPLSMTPPPAEKPREPIAARPSAIGPSIPSNIPSSREPSGPTANNANTTDSLADVVAALESDERSSSMPSRARTPTAQRFRQGNTGIGRLAANNSRRPQAPVEPPAPTTTPPRAGARRSSTEVTDYDIETEVGRDDWKSAIAVDDEQLVDWSAAEETSIGSQSTDEHGRKR